MYKAVQQDREAHIRSLQPKGRRKVQHTDHVQRPQLKVIVPVPVAPLAEVNLTLREAAPKALAATLAEARTVQQEVIQAEAAHDRAEAVTRVAAVLVHRAAAQVVQAALAAAHHRVADVKIS